ncbi:hypothetical protein CBM2589_A10208 [Cupriavidus taiwanensis]|uniref:Uncharacterized protein n=1 Tax=Cupriavidus taiwanensis TaxID=164546 RepID=A0A975X5I5_9BURK|nr:hypothetical protein CBM2589_A10208 [Cupriavidus taiwanensis]
MRTAVPHRCPAATAMRRQDFHPSSAPGHPRPAFAQSRHKCSIEHIFVQKNPFLNTRGLALPRDRSTWPI